ncbi:hypothetical protein IMG5_018390 [Ichthyophthirius multifiliis]|uniref:Uncharacterized protein n=1 Tax=Ichthyophthirius multifiliis TaxID=5932 RepID=G0QKI6_ICHMU|nr:hypothetical protein IMG5_018390 [Ichthyophthirius multifiliis]EGR34272.1 hypothetical protein IMG5_018390 [Ichthyophthirius multifiliis]|eukprot:XP_004039576.1 hypothetical protein IMG5_018390 [Ichthyophthirius multifiliis]
MFYEYQYLKDLYNRKHSSNQIVQKMLKKQEQLQIILNFWKMDLEFKYIIRHQKKQYFKIIILEELIILLQKKNYWKRQQIQMNKYYKMLSKYSLYNQLHKTKQQIKLNKKINKYQIIKIQKKISKPNTSLQQVIYNNNFFHNLQRLNQINKYQQSKCLLKKQKLYIYILINQQVIRNYLCKILKIQKLDQKMLKYLQIYINKLNKLKKVTIKKNVRQKLYLKYFSEKFQ